MSEETVYPLQIGIKIAGANNDSFQSSVVEIVQSHCPEVCAESVASRESGKGNYLSLTIQVTVNNRDHLQNLYDELHAHEDVKWVL